MTNIESQNGAMRSAFPVETTAKPRDPDVVVAQLRACLQSMAVAGLTVAYRELATRRDLSPPNTIHQITVALERLMEEDAEAGRLFIAALVISKARGGLPAIGFFEHASDLGRFTGDPNELEAWSFHAIELNAALKFWGGVAPASPNKIDGAALSGDACTAREAS